MILSEFWSSDREKTIHTAIHAFSTGGGKKISPNWIIQTLIQTKRALTNILHPGLGEMPASVGS